MVRPYDDCVALQHVHDRKPPWRPARFASVVVEELAEAIVGGSLAEGDVLPTEPALGERFGFSRTVIREALKMLEERGLVRVEQGRGTSVQPRDAWNLLDPLVLGIALAHDHDMSLLENLVAVRAVLEREMAGASAGNLTADDFEALDETLARMRESYDDYDEFRAHDLAFHAIVMKASGNDVGLTIVRVIHRHGGITPLLAAGASREALEQTTREHQEIYDALAAGDGDLAGTRIATHIEAAFAERKEQLQRS
jgi:GntR family galactonate operon transcriptional repressor